MRSRRVRVLLLSLLWAGMASAGDAPPYDPWVGTWSLDVPRSKFAEGFAVPKSQTIVIDFASATAVKFVSDETAAGGISRHIEFVAGYEGKVSELKGSPFANTVVLTQPRPHNRTFVYKKGEDVVATHEVVLWGNGLLMTITSREVRGGETIENVAYYRKRLSQ